MNNKNNTKKIIFFLFFITASVIAPSMADASNSEINYALIKEIKGEEMAIKYKSPAEDKGYVCNINSLDCEHKGTSTPELFPGVLGEENYTNSPDGNCGIISREYKTEESSGIYNILYSFKGETPELDYIIPFEKSLSWSKFSWDNEHVVLFGEDSTLARFSIKEKEMSTTTISQSYLPFKSLSPHAKFLSAYNYQNEEHRIWDLDSGKMIRVSSATPNFIEFSQDEKHAVFADTKDGYKTLYTANLENSDEIDEEENKIKSERLFKEDFMVKDYIFFKNDLYYVANKENPLKWSLFRYSFSEEESEKISGNVSYTDYIRPAGKDYLAFLKIEGKNTNVSLYEPKTDTTKTISPVEDADGFKNAKQEIIKIKDTQGVLLTPKGNKNGQLFVWLHGGPQRQTSIGYHSYLSYAVYDELLERLVNGGSYVLKLDYTGSIGYGQDSIKELDGGLGKVEVEDVINATEKLKDEYDIEKVHLIGNSYGGYLGPRALVEKPEIFDSAIAINGVFSWLSLIERIPSSPFKNYFAGRLNIKGEDSNFEEYSQSLIENKLPNISDEKLIFVYGEEDGTVPTWQTREFYALARSFGKNVSILSFPDEGHILRERENLNSLCSFISEELELKDVNCN